MEISITPETIRCQLKSAPKLAALALHPVTNSHHLDEDWHEGAWYNIITNHADKRSEHLDKHRALLEPSKPIVFGDESFTSCVGATYAKQPTFLL